ncbi:MAG: DUF3783 domain-containing protein [Proteobacteria bacterium]|nr:DUF3783 domain-containing protein [Pseudomonadota bacterium]
MNHGGKFRKVGKSEKKLHGHRKLIVCGYPDLEQRALLSLLEKNDFNDLPVIFVTNQDSKKAISELLTLDDRSGQDGFSDMRRAIIMSGFTQNELHRLMTAYRNSGLSTQLWATLTPVSENWPVEKLLGELAAEAEAFKKQR